MNIGDQIQSLVEQWAADLGDKMPVELWVWCAKDPGKPAVQQHMASIGRTGEERIIGQGADLLESRLNAEREWDKQGSPAVEQMEERKLRDKAAELGYRIEKIVPDDKITV